MGINGIQGQEISSIQIDNETKAYYLFDNLCSKAFLEYIKNHYEEDLYIVIPEKTDFEKYVFNLELFVKDKYNININGCKYHYIYANNFLNEVPTFLDNVIIDPQCYSQECFRYKQLLEHIKGELD